MATRTLTVTLAEETVQLLEAAIASGDFFSPADVISGRHRTPLHHPGDFDDWVRREAIPALEELEADPSTASPWSRYLLISGNRKAASFRKQVEPCISWYFLLKVAVTSARFSSTSNSVLHQNRRKPMFDQSHFSATLSAMLLSVESSARIFVRGCVALASNKVSPSSSLSLKAMRPFESPAYCMGGGSRRVFQIIRKSALLGAVIPVIFSALKPLPAQTSGCGLTSVKDGQKLIYPAIAQAAHVEGVIVAVVTFDHEGKPSDVRITSGPKMLQSAALDYAKALHGNPYSGSRECPMVETFRIEGQYIQCGTGPNDDISTAYFPHFKRLDLQHVELVAKVGCVTITRDPAVKRIHRFHL